MNCILPNHYTYLVGEYTDGEFWCSGEWKEDQIDKAREAFEQYRKNHPDQRIEMIQQTTSYKTIEQHLPSQVNRAEVCK
jgi:hypothetical protein